MACWRRSPEGDDAAAGGDERPTQQDRNRRNGVEGTEADDLPDDKKSSDVESYDPAGFQRRQIERQPVTEPQFGADQKQHDTRRQRQARSNHADDGIALASTVVATIRNVRMTSLSRTPSNNSV